MLRPMFQDLHDYYEANETAQALGYKVKKEVGVSAQQVQAVLPEAITEGRNSKDDETEYLQLAYTEVIPLLVAAIKEQQAIITQLQADVTSLKG